MRPSCCSLAPGFALLSPPPPPPPGGLLPCTPGMALQQSNSHYLPLPFPPLPSTQDPPAAHCQPLTSLYKHSPPLRPLASSYPNSQNPPDRGRIRHPEPALIRRLRSAHAAPGAPHRRGFGGAVGRLPRPREPLPGPRLQPRAEQRMDAAEGHVCAARRQPATQPHQPNAQVGRRRMVTEFSEFR